MDGYYLTIYSQSITIVFLISKIEWKFFQVIKRDVTRTYPEHDFFRDGGAGQQSLLNVMKVLTHALFLFFLIIK